MTEMIQSILIIVGYAALGYASGLIFRLMRDMKIDKHLIETLLLHAVEDPQEEEQEE